MPGGGIGAPARKGRPAPGRKPMAPLSNDLTGRFAGIVGKGHTLTGPEATAGYVDEPRKLFHRPAELVLRPADTSEVAAIVRLAAETRTPLVPQGGNTGLVGGQVPGADHGEVIVSLSRLNRIRGVDGPGANMIVEAGVTLAAAQEAAEAAERFFPLRLASEGSAQIGGNVSTNAGGTAVLAYGNTRDLVLGLEVVLADGTVWDGLRTLRKDNTGYDLKQLFIGAEGSLGIVTAAALKLFPMPKGRAVTFAGLDSPQAALQLLETARGVAGNELTAFELLPRVALDLVLRHAEGARDPLAESHPWYALIEISSPRSQEEAVSAAERLFAEGFEAGLIRDAVLAASLDQATALWQLRETVSEVQGREGGSIKHDVSVPLAAMPELIRRGSAEVAALIPGIRPVPFGHLGDGNLHFNFSQPVDMARDDFLALWDEVNTIVHRVVVDLGGSIAAEHGVGQLKRRLLPQVKSAVELDMMHRLKQAFDPDGILNPGKVL